MTLTAESEALLARFDGYLSEARAAGLDVQAESMIGDQVRRDLPAIEAAALARHVRETGCEGLADEARLVAQWSDAVDPMPYELRAELHDLGEHARVALAAVAPEPEPEPEPGCEVCGSPIPERPAPVVCSRRCARLKGAKVSLERRRG